MKKRKSCILNIVRDNRYLILDTNSAFWNTLSLFYLLWLWALPFCVWHCVSLTPRTRMTGMRGWSISYIKTIPGWYFYFWFVFCLFCLYFFCPVFGPWIDAILPVAVCACGVKNMVGMYGWSVHYITSQPFFSLLLFIISMSQSRELTFEPSKNKTRNICCVNVDETTATGSPHIKAFAHCLCFCVQLCLRFVSLCCELRIEGVRCVCVCVGGGGGVIINV